MKKDQINPHECKKCGSIKIPGTHHCSKCKACVHLMDHHCMWTGNCVGYMTHKPFFLFSFYLQLLLWLQIFTIIAIIRSQNMKHLQSMLSLLPFLPVHLGRKSVYESPGALLDGFTFYSLVLITIQDAYILGTFTLLTLGNTTWIDHLKTKSYSSKTKPKRTF